MHGTSFHAVALPDSTSPVSLTRASVCTSVWRLSLVCVRSTSRLTGTTARDTARQARAGQRPSRRISKAITPSTCSQLVIQVRHGMHF